MTAPRSEPDLTSIRKLAEEMAQGRKERTTSGHLLAAIASRPNPAADLLLERKLGAEVLLKAARATSDDEPDPLANAMRRAREVAARMGATGPTTLHLLIALIHDRKSGAHRALSQCGVDVSRLRAAAMQLALGLIGPRRATVRASADRIEEAKPGTVRATHGHGHAVRAPSPVSTSPSPAAPPGRVSSATPVPMLIHPPVSQRPSTPPQPMPVIARAKIAHEEPRKKPARSASRVSAEARYTLDPKLFPALSAIGKNLTLAAARGELDSVVGREAEIDQALDILAKRQANSPLFVGLPGVGKTSIARGVALRIAAGEGAVSLDDRIIVEIPIAELFAGTATRGSLAERFAAIRAESRDAAGRVVLFFDEIHTLFSADGSDEISGELKVALARGELPCIGTTTPEEYRRVFEADPGLGRRFTRLEVEEPTQEDAVLILQDATSALTDHHHVGFADAALALSVAWSVRYLPGRALPDKALSLLDLAGARARRRGLSNVDREGVAEVVAELAGMPIERLLETDRERMLALESILAERVVGHGPALAKIATILRRNAAGLRSRRPIGSFLLLGPTGVGKTETAKAVAEALFHSQDAMTRLDLAEFSEAHAVARLIGAPPGYIGHDAGGYLTEAVRKRPYQVILLDEMEKAHPDVLQSFLAVFDEGRLTDGRGKTVDFTNTVIVLTSNIGSQESATRGRRGIGFGSGANEAEQRNAASERVIAAARAALAPELFNRFDEVIAFAPLLRAEVAEVARRQLGALHGALGLAHGIRLDVEDAAVEALLDAGGYDPELGARPMKRTIARLVEAPIAEMILRGDVRSGDVVLVSGEGREVIVDAVRSDAPDFSLT